MISVKLMFTTIDYDRIAAIADVQGLTIDNYLHTQATQQEHRI
jgi:hypothetical protein